MEIINILKQKAETLIDWIYPRRCPVCDRVSPYGTRICPACRGALTPVSQNCCVKCGKPLRRGQIEYCGDCKEREHAYFMGRAAYIYQGEIRASIYRMKYGGRREYAEFYGKQMWMLLGDFIKATGAEALIPVPLSSKKMAKRGYNQAQCLAKALSKEAGIPVLDDLVVRIRDTAPQKQLDESERQKKKKKAFKIGRNDVELKITIIIDDIYTTGSTIDAVARVLKKAGVRRIYFVALAIGKQ